MGRCNRGGEGFETGNTRTAALVSHDGSVEWMCAPDFDSGACFTALVGYDEHGRWAIRPTVPVREVRQRYDGDTLVLVRESTCEGGALRLVDFMPPGHRCDFVRIVESVRGEVPFEMVLRARFDFGANTPWSKSIDDGVILTAGPDALALRGDLPLVHKDGEERAQHVLRAGERAAFQLTWSPSHEPPAAAAGCRRRASSHDRLLVPMGGVARLQRQIP